jgi:hypothetical protein
MPLIFATLCGGTSQLEERLNNSRRDRVVTAAGAQRRHSAFVVAHREAERVALEPLVHDLRLCDRRHAATPCAAYCSKASVTQR